MLRWAVKYIAEINTLDDFSNFRFCEFYIKGSDVFKMFNVNQIIKEILYEELWDPFNEISEKLNKPHLFLILNFKNVKVLSLYEL